MSHAVARQAELIYRAIPQQSRICRTVRRMASRAAFGLHGRVLERERPLFVDVALDTSRISARRQPRLLQLKSAMRVVTVAATHAAFQNLVMEGRGKCRLDLAVATHTKLRIVRFQHANGREAGLLCIRGRHQHVRAGNVAAFLVGMRRVTISATDVITPVLSATKVVSLFFPRVTGQTRLRDFFRRLVRKSNYLCLVAASIDVGFPRAVTGFTPGYLVLPTRNSRKRGVRGVRIRLKGVFVTVFASVAANVITRGGLVINRRATNGLRTIRRRQPNHDRQH